jgi:hypothetical protein
VKGPLFTFVFPTYGGRRFLAEALESPRLRSLKTKLDRSRREKEVEG